MTTTRKFLASLILATALAGMTACESDNTDDWCDSGNPAKRSHATNCD